MKLNTRVSQPTLQTHEGGIASPTTSLQQLERSVLSCLLWEHTFYESGESIASRISKLCIENQALDIHNLARKARKIYHLRHVPLLLLTQLLKKEYKYKAQAIADVISRPDELAELITIYWKDGKKPLPHQLKKGIQLSLRHFYEYELAKWQGRGNKVTLQDVIRLTHPKPRNDDEALLWRSIVKGELRATDTWETRLSSGEDTKEVFTDLLLKKELGGLALLRNLRNMIQAGVSRTLIKTALTLHPFLHVLPFSFITAAKVVPEFKKELDTAFLRIARQGRMLEGRTVILVDVSSSMDCKLTSKSDITRIDAACGVAMICRELNTHCDVFTFSDNLVKCLPMHGMALRDAIVDSQAHMNTYLKEALIRLYSLVEYDRLIIITDEQSNDGIASPPENTRNYLINVATYQNGVSYTPEWVHIDGFSEAVVRFIQSYEDYENS